MKTLLLLLTIGLVGGCEPAYDNGKEYRPGPPPRNDCDELARKYGANVIQQWAAGEGHSGYARLRDDDVVWKSSGKDVTKTVTAKTTWETKRLIADEMRPGVRQK